MFFNRGSAGDYDAWEKLGNPGWSWNDLLPYFKKVGLLLCLVSFYADAPVPALKSETFTPPPEELAAQYPISGDLSPHGTDGPVGSSFSVYQYPVLGMDLLIYLIQLDNPRSWKIHANRCRFAEQSTSTEAGMR